MRRTRLIIKVQHYERNRQATTTPVSWYRLTGTHSTRLGSGYYNNRRHSYVRR